MPTSTRNCLENKVHASVPNLTIKELDLAKLDSISEKFDRIHCRFVLSHMPWNSTETLLPLLLSKLTPSGFLVIEEIATLDSLTCEPFSEEYELWKTYVNIQFDTQGSDRAPGEHLYEYLQTNGYDFVYQTHQPMLKQKREKMILALGIRSIGQGLINKKIASCEQIFESQRFFKKFSLCVLWDSGKIAFCYSKFQREPRLINLNLNCFPLNNSLFRILQKPLEGIIQYECRAIYINGFNKCCKEKPAKCFYRHRSKRFPAFWRRSSNKKR